MINLDSNVYEMMINHALSNEKEEVMGMLLGNVDFKLAAKMPFEEDSLEKGRFSCNVRVSIILERLDKRADRVEISPEQLSMAAEYAEKLSNDLKMSLNICGWYHSHPHITVFPSNVDIKTQLLYQTMDKNFIGLIVSVYNQNKKTFVDTVEIIGFQSVDDNFIKIPINICVNEDNRLIEQNFQTLFKIPEILTQEEINQFKQHSQNNANFLCNLSNLGLYMHSMSQILDCSFVETINTLECRTKTNEILIRDAMNKEDVKMDADE